MSIEQLADQVLHPPRDASRSFTRWFYEHENQIVEPREDDEVGMATKAEILRRSEGFDANPGLAVPVTDEWFEQLKRRLGEASSQAPAGGMRHQGGRALVSFAQPRCGSSTD